MKQYLFILLSGIIIGLLISQLITCDRMDNIQQDIKYITSTDTVYTRTTDTVHVPYPVYIKGDSIKVTTLIPDSLLVTRFSINDSNFTGDATVYAKSPADSLVLSGEFNCKEVTHYDTLTITKHDSIIVTNIVQNKSFHNFYLATGAGFTNSTLVNQDFKLYYTNRKLLLGAGIEYSHLDNNLYYKASLGLKVLNKKNKTKIKIKP